MKSRTILGTRVDATDYAGAAERVCGWARAGESRYVCAANVHMVMEGYDDPAFRAVVNRADMVTADGMPLAWALRLLGVHGAPRVYGPDLMLAVCARAEAERLPVGLHGGTPQALAALDAELRRRFPALRIVHRASPPFRPLTERERALARWEIAGSGARILFVGLGCPRQERWMAEERGSIPAVMVGVGAAFDFISGQKRQAPRLLGRLGLEWAFRLAAEPRRLGRRYLVHNPRFAVFFALQLARRARGAGGGRTRSHEGAGIMNIHYEPTETAAHTLHPQGPRWNATSQAARAGRLDPVFWRHRRVLVTGGSGFLGSHVIDHLQALGCTSVVVPRRRRYDLTRQDAVSRLYDDAVPDLVIHLAARVGGIGANRAHPGTYFYENLVMGALMIEEARRRDVEKFVQVGTICAYPRDTPVPFREEDLWNGYPEETNAPYGIAKKALLAQLQAYRQQWGFDGIYLLPVNLYGPRDNFDLDGGHVIPALIRRMLEARDTGLGEVVLWGTGAATREFLHVEDAARGILLAAEHYHGAEPVNLGTGEEIAIRDLAVLVAELTGYTGRIAYDPSQPDGQPRRRLDTRRARARFGFEARTPLREGLAETIRWYDVHRQLPAADEAAPPLQMAEAA